MAALVVLVAVHPATTITSGLLATSPMVWIGKRSYGIYLWHWPVFLVTRPGLDIPLTGIPLFVLRVGITVGLAAASYRFVEVPIRSGALSRRLAALQHAAGQPSMLQRRRVRTRLGFAAGAVVVTTVMLGIGLAVAQPAPRPPGFPAKPANLPLTATPHAGRARSGSRARGSGPDAHSHPQCAGHGDRRLRHARRAELTPSLHRGPDPDGRERQPSLLGRARRRSSTPRRRTAR